MTVLLTASQCEFGFPERKIAQADMFIVEQGTFNLLLGGNGAGKSTILATIGLELPLLKGTLQFSNIHNLSVRNRIGYVQQRVSVPQYLPINLNEFVMLGGTRLLNEKVITKSSLIEKAHSLLSELGLYDLRTSPIGQLSVGQLQRATIAREVLGEPLILLLDETTSGIDVKHQTSVMNILDRLRINSAIILATHDLHHVRSDVDWVYSIEDEALSRKTFAESRCC